MIKSDEQKNQNDNSDKYENEKININIKLGKNKIKQIKITKRTISLICLAISITMLFIAGSYASKYRTNDTDTTETSITNTDISE